MKFLCEINLTNFFQGMVECSPPNIICDTDLLTSSDIKYFSNNETYGVTNSIHGTFIDVLQFLQNSFNFTTKLYKRKDGQWGNPVISPNGTVQIGGMLLNLYDHSAEFLWAPYSFLPER